MVEQMLELHKRRAAASGHDRELYQRHAIADDTDHEIDRLVYGLYDLTPEEIALVEDQEGKP